MLWSFVRLRFERAKYVITCENCYALGETRHPVTLQFSRALKGKRGLLVV